MNCRVTAAAEATPSMYAPAVNNWVTSEVMGGNWWSFFLGQVVGSQVLRDTALGIWKVLFERAHTRLPPLPYPTAGESPSRTSRAACTPRHTCRADMNR